MVEENFPQRLGTRFTIFASIILLGMMTYYFDIYLDKQHNPNQQVTAVTTDNSREVILNRNRAGHYVTTANINDHKITVMLDTGASDVSIPEHLAEKLDLQRGPAFEATTANGIITVYATVINKIQLGNIELVGVRASINPYMDENEVLLGMSVLKQLDFSQQGNQLTLKQYK